MTIISEDNYLIGLCFDDSKYANKVLNKDYIYFEDEIILLTKKWLNISKMDLWWRLLRLCI